MCCSASPGGGETPLTSRPAAVAPTSTPEASPGGTETTRRGETTSRVDVEVSRATDSASAIAQALAGLNEELIAFRQDLHANPELSWKETRTTEKISTALQAAGMDPQPLTETTGVWVDIGPEHPQTPYAAAFRADIDALPVAETTGLPYASTVEGVAHACGHDIHTTVMLGLALALHRTHTQRIQQGNPAGLGAKIRVIFQPSEEQLPGGAREVVRQGLLQPIPRVFALHCDPKFTVGTIGTRIGPITSASDQVRVAISGRGGHTSRPHLTEDVVGALAHIATSVPAILSRRIDVRSGVSLVWGNIQAGNAANSIPSHGVLHGTLRILDADAWVDAGHVLESVVAQAAAPYGVDVDLDHIRGSPPVNNTEAETTLLEEAAKAVLHRDSVTLAVQSMGGEDFGWMTHEVPGSMLRLGTKTPGGETYDLHQGNFAPDEEAIAIGTRVMAQVAELSLRQQLTPAPEGQEPDGLLRD